MKDRRKLAFEMPSVRSRAEDTQNNRTEKLAQRQIWADELSSVAQRPEFEDFFRRYGRELVERDLAELQASPVHERRVGSPDVQIAESAIVVDIMAGHLLPGCEAFRTSLYDDIFRGIDFWINLNSPHLQDVAGRVIGVDATTNPHALEEKLEKVRTAIDTGRRPKLKYFIENKISKPGARPSPVRGEKEVMPFVLFFDEALLDRVVENRERGPNNLYLAIALEQVLLQLEVYMQYAKTRDKKRAIAEYQQLKIAMSFVLEQQTSLRGIVQDDVRNALSLQKMQELLRNVFDNVISNESALCISQYIPMQESVFMQAVEEDGILPPEPDMNGWQSVRHVELEHGLQINSLRRQFNHILTTGQRGVEWATGFNAKNHQTVYFSPGAIQRVLTARESGASLRPDAVKEQDQEWQNPSQFAAQLGVSWIYASTVLELTIADHPEWKKAVTTTSNQREYALYHRDAFVVARDFFDNHYRRILDLQKQGFRTKGQVYEITGITSFKEFQQEFFANDTTATVVVQMQRAGQRQNFTFYSDAFVQDLLEEMQRPIPAGYLTEGQISQKHSSQESIAATVIDRLVAALRALGCSDDDIFVTRFCRQKEGHAGGVFRKTRYYSPLFEEEYTKDIEKRTSIPEGFQTINQFLPRYCLSKSVVRDTIVGIIEQTKDPSQYQYVFTKGAMTYYYYSQSLIDRLDVILPLADWLGAVELQEKLGLSRSTFNRQIAAYIEKNGIDPEKIRSIGTAKRVVYYFSPDFSL